MAPVVVTGANKGLGLEIIVRLLRTDASKTILLGTRSLSNGKAAISRLQERGLDTTNVRILELDVSKMDSVQAAAETVKKGYGGQLDCVYNNAGVVSTTEYEEAKQLMQVNYYGVKRMMEVFDPLIVRGGHDVIVSSGMGAWATYHSPLPLQNLLTEPSKTTPAQLDDLAERYLESLNTHNPSAPELQKEFPISEGMIGPYAVSKAFLNAYVRNIAPSRLEKQGIILSVACPGFCATDLNSNSGPRKASTGARSIVLASQISSEQAGGFFRDGKPANFIERTATFEEMAEDARTVEQGLREAGEIMD
ncbi:NAD(P)-binding protein [Microstroma glucosiphilum]|uniref:NAD(P)-binding protein n=1 Tax=Pseudomicrostroma glucosiphilum TaxID=1684307 RepID=A0A316U1M0_9BASI|nr:NAD(P)-binding protein [Pseudomicrostroma glucosiphilum]PWN18381.1 NAD(P)-binding protein [Pseudomicrostroma glucosiphilum]